MKKILLSAGLLCASLFAAAQCDPQATLNEDFSNFTIATSWNGQNCWSKIATGFPNGGMVYTAQLGEPANQYVTFYAATAVNAYSYLLTPEVSTFDGGHQLSFSAWKLASNGSVPAGTVTVQVGTISNVTDASTFVAVGEPVTISTEGVQNFSGIVIPTAVEGSHIAFRMSADTQHNALAIDNVVWDAIPVPACEAVATLNEDFSEFVSGTAGSLPQNCWTSSHTYPMVNVSGENEDKFVSVYSANSPNTPIYVVSPEISTLDGNHKLSFTALRQAPILPNGSISIQVGTLATPDDYTTFVPFGDALPVTSTTNVQYSDILIPASATQKHIAFQVTATSIHTALTIDNVAWEPVTAGVETVKANAFSIFPNPTADRNVTLTYNTIDNGHVSVYAITGAKVFETAVSGNTQNISLYALSAGMYVVKLQSGTSTATQKLIIK